MSPRDRFDEWATAGRDREMAERHWRTAGPILDRMPVEGGQTVLDLGTGSGYAARALRADHGAGRVYGLDAAPEMVANASGTTDDPAVGYVVGDFGDLPFADGSVDHAFSMEAFYYAADPMAALEEVRRVLHPGGTYFCAVNYYEENVHAHDWPARVGVEMIRWSRPRYRAAFRETGLHVATQMQVPDRQTPIPPTDAFPTDGFETRAAMVERYRELGTLLTVGVAP